MLYGVFTRPVSGAWTTIKLVIFACVLLGLFWSIRRNRGWIFILLPISYFGVALLLGSRLWAHHFGVFVASAYLLLAMFIGYWATTRSRAIGAACFAVLFLCGNVHQADNFFRSLNGTGGVNRTTDALNRLAYDALSEPRVLYVFPDWGFFMGFNLLTENKVRFTLDPASIPGVRNGAGKVSVAFWSKSDEAKYVELLKQDGATATETKTYRRRDGEDAFWVVTGDFASVAAVADK